MNLKKLLRKGRIQPARILSAVGNGPAGDRKKQQRQAESEDESEVSELYMTQTGQILHYILKIILKRSESRETEYIYKESRLRNKRRGQME